MLLPREKHTDVFCFIHAVVPENAFFPPADDMRGGSWTCYHLSAQTASTAYHFLLISLVF